MTTDAPTLTEKISAALEQVAAMRSQLDGVTHLDRTDVVEHDGERFFLTYRYGVVPDEFTFVDVHVNGLLAGEMTMVPDLEYDFAVADVEAHIREICGC